jgi:hypothetical protein
MKMMAADDKRAMLEDPISDRTLPATSACSVLLACVNHNQTYQNSTETCIFRGRKVLLEDAMNDPSNESLRSNPLLIV